MSKVVEVVFCDQLVADIQPMLIQSRMDLGDYILKAVTWYTRYLRQEQAQPEMVSWSDVGAEEQAQLLMQVHEELAPYTVDVMHAVLGEGEDEEDWEALFA